MSTRRHRKKIRQRASEQTSFVEEEMARLRRLFPKAEKWVLFTFVQAQEEAAIGNPSNRIDLLNEQWQSFKENPATLPFKKLPDILIAESTEENIENLKVLYHQHIATSKPICCLADGDHEASIGYEYYWSE